MSRVKEIILELIQQYKEIPCLWDKNHKDYKNQDRRNQGYRVLLQTYKALDPHANSRAMNKKIHNLRTNYFKELQKVKSSYQNCSSADDIYVPTLYYYDAMSFLESHFESTFNTTRDPLNDTEEDFAPASSDGETTPESYVEASNKPLKKKYKFKQESFSNLREEHMADEGRIELITSNDKEEDCIIIGKAIGLQLRDLDKKTSAIAQKIISDAIFYAKMGRLTENSSIDLGPPVDHSYTTN